ncbi:MAG: tRNA pseudouridine(38-40) synthase TruA [Anaerolineaceae bacterium 4572_32.2]|nr:MAG: tRNA pseudouridine(38-40) synthase TruA [Anaerolineaceae bacterium 4572_32.2]
MRVRVVVAYDGTDYSGFQRQTNAPTVQAALETTLAQVTQEEITILAAGRTDTGVHAVGQVIAFDTAWRHDLGDLRRALNAVLPADIAALEVEEAAPDFHPRYDAHSRRYRYTLHNATVRQPLKRRYSLHIAALLDVAAMQQAAQALVGEHDFATFGQPPQGLVTVRRVLLAEWGGEPPHLTFDIEANAFLYRMVRSIVGTLLQVGQGKMDVAKFVAAMTACERRRAGPTAPPHGLCLMEVKY